jgi:hypothetical protein
MQCEAVYSREANSCFFQPPKSITQLDSRLSIAIFDQIGSLARPIP